MASSVLIYKIIDAFNSHYTVGEILLNLLFIIILITLSVILYWDNINTKVNKISRCKRQIEISNKNQFIIHATDKSNNNLFEIEYDTNQYNTNVECKCKPGKYINNFENIPVKDLKQNKDVKINKVCSCDKYYNTGMINENIVYDGEPGILRYMTTKNSDFFDQLVYAAYNK